ncbi:MAG TPA: ATP synthase F1 subunit delta [Gemmatimonadales bacterium]|nr:ATP synthase F1 subunit delta [Gemmatimonadales bacterium]
MRNTSIARNYAEALLAAAERARAVERCGELIDGVAGVLASDPVLAGVLMSPRIAKADKQRLVERALKGVAPAVFVRFLQSVIQRGRQGVIGDIAAEYERLVDVHLGRVHAVVSTARASDAALQASIVERLTAVFGREVRAHFRTDPALLGGVVVRSGDRVFDGSLRRRLKLLRHRMLHAQLGGGERAG